MGHSEYDSAFAERRPWNAGRKIGQSRSLRSRLRASSRTPSLTSAAMPTWMIDVAAVTTVISRSELTPGALSSAGRRRVSGCP